MIGFEVELDRRVADTSGGEIPGDTDLASCSDGEFTVVTDSRDAESTDGTLETIEYSNIELVTKPFDHMLGDTTAIFDALRHMREFAASCYKIGAAASLEDVLGSSGLPYSLTAAGATAVVHPDTNLIEPVENVYYKVPDKGMDSLYVQYTLGFPVLKLGVALEWLTGKVRAEAEDPVPDGADFPVTNARRATRAGKAAAELFRRWADYRRINCTDEESAALAGYVSLVYTQLAAAVDHAYAKESTQVKNKTIAICRVPLRAVAGVLPDHVRQYLREQSWVDMLNEFAAPKTADGLARFINARTSRAMAVAKDRTEIGTTAEKALGELALQIADLKRQVAAIDEAVATLGKHDDATGLIDGREKAIWALDDLRKQARKNQELLSDYRDAESASQAWQTIQTQVPDDLRKLHEGRKSKQFPWSVISHAIVPALEGRQLADDLTSQEDLDGLFVNSTAVKDQIAPDNGIVRNLDTRSTTNMDGEEVMLVEYLWSALLCPAQRTIGPTKVFGGMKEIATPDSYTDGNAVQHRLIPLELRSHGTATVSWDELKEDLLELATYAAGLLPPPPVPLGVGTATESTDTTQTPSDETIGPPNKRQRTKE